jgi:CheY-like chemotaxis protein
MSLPQRISVLGFTPIERVTIEALFRLSHRRQRPYEVEPTLGDADFLLVDADHPQAFDQVVQAGGLDRCLLIGDRRRAGAAAQLPRPIHLTAILQTLDKLLERQTPAAVAAVAPDVAVGGIDLDLSLRADSDIMVHAEPRPIAWPPTLDFAGPTPPDPLPAVLDHILVVDDNDAALRFMALHLNRFGFQVHLARSGAGALARLARRHFEFVFVDAGIAAMGGFGFCKALKQGFEADHRPPPTVVLMTRPSPHPGPPPAVLPGCDAVLAKPLMELDLLAVVGDREVQQHGYASTLNASPTMF